MNSFYVSYNGFSVFVKESAFFISQGGLTEDWGKGWTLVYADTIEHARTKGELMVERGQLK